MPTDSGMSQLTASINTFLTEQVVVIDSMSRLVENFKKLGQSKFSVPKAQARLESLKELWRRCTNAHIQLLQAVPEAQRPSIDYFKNEEYLEAEMMRDEISDYFLDVIEKCSTPSDQNNSFHASSSFAHGDNETGSVRSFVPRVELPKFSGSLLEWESFRDLFESLVIRNAAISNAQNLYYLKQYVTDEAANLIKHIRVSDANFESAWSILRTEYDNPYALIHKHIETFVELPVMRTETALELKRLRDTVSASLLALKNLDRSTDKWDDLLVFIIQQKFSPRTKMEWNLHTGGSTAYPSYKQMQEFLTQRIRGISKPIKNELSGIETHTDRPHRARASVHVASEPKCTMCGSLHRLFRCSAFRRASLEQRYQHAKQTRCCFNCLKVGHFPKGCPSSSRCQKCQLAHHTLLHRGVESAPLSDAASAAPMSNAVLNSPTSGEVLTASTALSARENAPVLLATAQVALRTNEGQTVLLRALLDQGSTYSFVSETLAQTLCTRRTRVNVNINGFGSQHAGIARSQIQVNLTPRNCDTPALTMTALVFQKITSYAVTGTTHVELWPHLRGLELADPEPASRQPIHLLIGADLYGALLRDGLRQGPLGSPTAQATMFGWIISGPASSTLRTPTQASAFHTLPAEEPLDAQLRRFWELDELPKRTHLSLDELQCEEHFRLTHSRDSTGRYIVRLPFRTDPTTAIGQSHAIALRLYHRLERRLSRDPALAEDYNNFLFEYEKLDHMRAVTSEGDAPSTIVYLPYHAVLKQSSATTKVRVVFNASQPTSNGTTLNSFLLPGPKLQLDLSAIIIRWRLHRFVYTADIEKMFRQILIHPEDADYQRILWRRSAVSEIQAYRLTTVTYGTASAPYLANRVLRQLAQDEGHAFPAAAEIIRDQTYVDDTIFGADSLEEIQEQRSQIIQLLKRGGFRLRKWASNCEDLCRDVTEEDRTEEIAHALQDSEAIKILGIEWRPREDAFYFSTAGFDTTVTPTKRTILSFVAKIFDPLGWIAPCVIYAEIFIQELWLLKSDWDTPISLDLAQKWSRYVEHLPKIKGLRIPRWIGHGAESISIELHGFADASSRAYAAVIYARVTTLDNDIRVNLLISKTRVAPLKTLSIPKLELCGALLLAQLFKFVSEQLKSTQISMFGWTDSTVVLEWIRQHPSKWNVFVANRVSEIQNLTPRVRWAHVLTHDNPADCASRGLTATELVSHALWWEGPPWLRCHSTRWPCRQKTEPATKDECAAVVAEERKSATVAVTAAGEEWDLPFKISSWPRLLRVTAYIFRFVHNSRARCRNHPRQELPLSVNEVDRARYVLASCGSSKCFPPRKGSVRLRSCRGKI